MCVDSDRGKLDDLRMANIKELGKFSYDLEEKREQSLVNQSSQMVAAFSVFSIAIYTILPVLKDIPGLSFGKLLFCVAIVSSLMLASLVSAVAAQWRFKYFALQTIDEFYEAVNRTPDAYQVQAQFDAQWRMQIQAIHSKKQEVNNKRVKLVQTSMVLFFSSIGVMVLSAIALAFISI